MINNNDDDKTTKAIAILIGKLQGHNDSHTVPLVVWVASTSTSSTTTTTTTTSTTTATTTTSTTWEYYEFLDDTTRWTHLDGLLLRFGGGVPKPNLYVGTCDASSMSSSMSSNHNQRKTQRILETLRMFLEDRQQQEEPQNENNDDDDHNDNHARFFGKITVDQNQLESKILPLLAEEEDRFTYQRTIQSSVALQQGLELLWQGGVEEGGVEGVEEGGVVVKLSKGMLDSSLVMDKTAAECIHLLPPSNAGVASIMGGNHNTNSLWGILSQPCCTSMGKQKLQVWLRQPLVSLNDIQHRQDAVTQLLGLGKDCVMDALKSLAGHDLGKLTTQLGHYQQQQQQHEQDEASNNGEWTNTKKPLQLLYRLYLLAGQQLPQLLEAMESVVENDNNNNSNTTPSSSSLLRSLQSELTNIVHELHRCQGLAEAVLDLDQAPREFLIKPTFDQDLQELHEQLQTTQHQIEDCRSDMQELWNQECCSGGSGDYYRNNKSSEIRLEEIDHNLNSAVKFQFRLPNTNDTKVLQQIPTVQLHQILKNGVYFSTKELRQNARAYQDLLQEYNSKSQNVVKDAMSVAVTYRGVVDRASRVVAVLDVLCALAYVADTFNYCKPTLTDGDTDGLGIELIDARHPCVELQEGMRTDEKYIPNDVSLHLGGGGGDTNNKNSPFLVITGPNMGGKSTYIRSLGAIVCMAQIGSYVPCTSAKINIVHSILARVGAGDLQERGISTFMAEMLEASSILRTATKRSLIIIDELGRGTSTFDGYGLARAISEYLMKSLGCMVVFATHFHELTRLQGVQNCHVTAQTSSDGGLTFLYKVQPGPCLESFGIRVAELANVPACVIADAKRKAEELESFGTHKNNKNKKQKQDDDEYDSNVAFLSNFAAMDLPQFLHQQAGFANDDEKRTKLLGLLSMAA